MVEKQKLLRKLVARMKNIEQNGIGADGSEGILDVNITGYESRDFLAFSLEKLCDRIDIFNKNRGFDDYSANEEARFESELDAALSRFPDWWIEEAQEKTQGSR